QPAVRAWGRVTTIAAARRDLPPVALPGPVRRLPGGALALPASGDRAAMTERIVAALRRSGLPVAGASDWDDRDAVVRASLLVHGDLVTSGFPHGTVQVRVRRRLRTGAAALVLGALAAGAVAAADAARGVDRTGRAVRRALTAAGEQR